MAWRRSLRRAFLGRARIGLARLAALVRPAPGRRRLTAAFRELRYIGLQAGAHRLLRALGVGAELGHVGRAGDAHVAAALRLGRRPRLPLAAGGGLPLARDDDARAV